MGALWESERNEPNREELDDERRDTSIPAGGHHLKGRPKEASINLPYQNLDTSSRDKIVTGENTPSVPNELSNSAYKVGSKYFDVCVGVPFSVPSEGGPSHEKPGESATSSTLGTPNNDDISPLKGHDAEELVGHRGTRENELTGKSAEDYATRLLDDGRCAVITPSGEARVGGGNKEGHREKPDAKGGEQDCAVEDERYGEGENGGGAGAQANHDRDRLETSEGEEQSEAEDEVEPANVRSEEEKRQDLEMVVGSLVWVLVRNHTCLCADSWCGSVASVAFYAINFSAPSVPSHFPTVQQKTRAEYVPSMSQRPPSTRSPTQQCRYFPKYTPLNDPVTC